MDRDVNLGRACREELIQGYIEVLEARISELEGRQKPFTRIAEAEKSAIGTVSPVGGRSPPTGWSTLRLPLFPCKAGGCAGAAK